MSLLPSAVFERLATVFYDTGLKGRIEAQVAGQPQLRLLDVACGTGALTAVAGDCSYVGVDVSLARLRRACRNNTSSVWAVADASALPFGPAVFDRVLVSGLFHHVDDSLADRIQAEIARVTAPAGHVVVFEAIWPRNACNITGAIARALDEGRFIRNPSEYLELWSSRFTIEATEYPSRLSLDYLLVTLRPRS